VFGRSLIAEVLSRENLDLLPPWERGTELGYS
jgi:hypothetical protein